MKKLTAAMIALSLITSAASMLPAAAEDSSVTYAGILEDFREQLGSGFDQPGVFGINYPADAGFGTVWGETEWELTPENTGFAFVDLDEDGETDEMVIGTLSNDGRGNTIEEIYTRDESEFTHLAAAGTGHSFTITDKNQVYENVVEQTDDGVLYKVNIYDLDQGMLRLAESYCCDDVNYYSYAGMQDGEEVWEPIEQQDYAAKTGIMTKAIEMTPFTAFPDEPVPVDTPAVDYLAPAQEEALYADILTFFRDRINKKSEEFPDDNKNAQGMTLMYPVENDLLQGAVSTLWYGETFSDGCYAITDIDGDGRRELVVGVILPDGTPEIYDVYTYNGGRTLHLASAGEKLRIMLTADERLLFCDTSEEGSVYYTLCEIGAVELYPAEGWACVGSDYSRAENFRCIEGTLDCDWNGCTKEDYLNAMLGYGMSGLMLLEPLSAQPDERFGLQWNYSALLDYVDQRLEKGFDQFPDDIVSGNGALLADGATGVSALWYAGAADETPDNMGYAFEDLDGDGTWELLIGSMDEDGMGTIYDIFGDDGNCYYHYASASERDHFSVSVRNLIMEDGSNGADSNVKILYRIADQGLEPAEGYKAENGAYYRMASYVRGELTYEFTWEEITKEAYDEAVALHRVQSFRFRPFRDYQFHHTDQVGLEGYFDIIDRVGQHVTRGFANYADEDQGLYGILSGNPEAFSYLCYRFPDGITLDNTGYLLADLNMDGHVELLLIGNTDMERATLYDVYTMYEGRITHVASSGERLQFFFDTQGILASRGSSSAASHVINLYDFAYDEDGTAHLVIRGGYEREEDKYYRLSYDGEAVSTRTEISEVEYIGAYNRYATSLGIPVTSIADYLEVPTVQEDEEALYAPVIEMLREALANAEAHGQYDYSPLWFMPYDGMVTEHAGYAITDLDGDGTRELVLGTIDADGNGMIFDLYTVSDNTAYHIASAGERDSFALTSRGQIVEQRSNSADSSEIIFYFIGNTSLDPASGFKFEGGRNYKLYSYKEGADGGLEFNWVETDETAEAFNYENIKMTPLSDTAPSENSGLGDFNGDGLVNAADASEVLIAAARIGAGETDVLTESQTASGDTNRDGAVNAEDAANILQYAAYVGAGGDRTFEAYQFGQADSEPLG